MQRFIDSVLGVAKESLKAFSQESFNNTVKVINGISALILTFLPGKATILEGVRGWELRPTLRAPRLPRWMEEGVSSFNQFIHEYAADPDTDSESEHESYVDDNDSIAPSSPSSQSSQLSKSSSFRFERRDSSRFKLGSLVRRVPSYVKHVLGMGEVENFAPRGPPSRPDVASHIPRRTDSSGSLYRMYGLASKGLTSVMDSVIHRTTDRRRGIIEDLQMVVELFIERVFDVVRRILLYGLSPLQTLKIVARKVYNGKAEKDTVTVQTATLGDSDPAPSTKKAHPPRTMNTDARSCEDVITELGYPYEAIRVVTDDGYLLLMERIPRHDSRKVLYFQHGILDSSLGWVSNGVVGSQAFAAHDQGYDVFLGNLRGLASREHIDKNISSQRYWSYSINEHGVQDIPAMVNKIHSIKMQELQSLDVSPSLNESNMGQPYTICGLAHSLGGAALLMYVVSSRLQGKEHRLSRLILLSPAGFHEDAPLMCSLMQYIFPAMAPILAPLVPGLYIRTKIFRGLFNKVARDFQNYPAVGGLVQTLCSYVVGGDSSNWIEAFGQTHYNMYDMPGVAYRVVVHFSQMKRAKRFQMYDYGTASANMAAYGTPYPPDIGDNYGVIDIPVDLVAGRKDKLIPRSMVRRHYQLLKDKGCTVSYSEFEYAHLDFTFAHREEVLAYVMSKLLLVTPPESLVPVERGRRSKVGSTKLDNRRDSKKPKAGRARQGFEQENAEPASSVYGIEQDEDHKAKARQQNLDGEAGYMNGTDVAQIAASLFDEINDGKQYVQKAANGADSPQETDHFLLKQD